MIFCEQSRGDRHIKPVFGTHNAMMTTDDHLYTPDPVCGVSCPVSTGRCSQSPVMSAFAQYGSVFHPDYSRLVDVYRPFAVPATPLEMDPGLQHEDIMAIRQCRYDDSASTPGAQSTQSQQDFEIAIRASDYTRQRQLR